MNAAERAAPLIFGGLLIGIWLYFILFEFSDGGWTWWGLAGLVLGSAGYAARFADPLASMAIWAGVGIVAGLAITAAFVGQDPTFLAAALTAGGAASIARSAAIVMEGRRADEEAKRDVRNVDLEAIDG